MESQERGGVIYIVRHGATKLNNQTDMSEDRIRGWTDVPLAEEGRKEAQAAGLKLKSKGIQAIVASTLSRAHETAEIIGKIVGVKPVASEGLRPWNLGEFTGKSTKEVLPKLVEYVRDKPDKAVPKGESFNQFKERAFAGLADAIEANQGKVLAIVTHHRNERLYEAWEKAGRPEDLSIDLDEFLQKGDPPGGIKELAIGDVEKWEPTPDGGLGHPSSLNQNQGTMPSDSTAKPDASPKRITSSATKLSPDMPQRTSTASPAGKNGLSMQNPSDPSMWVNMNEFPNAQSVVQPPSNPKARLMAMAHGRAIAGAKALHAVGHISDTQRDKHIGLSRKAIAKAALFGKRG